MEYGNIQLLTILGKSKLCRFIIFIHYIYFYSMFSRIGKLLTPRSDHVTLEVDGIECPT